MGGNNPGDVSGGEAALSARNNLQSRDLLQNTLNTNKELDVQTISEIKNLLASSSPLNMDSTQAWLNERTKQGGAVEKRTAQIELAKQLLQAPGKRQTLLTSEYTSGAMDQSKKTLLGV